MKAIFGDIETLSLDIRAMVLSIGAVYIDLSEEWTFEQILNNSVELLVGTDLQYIAKRHVSASTVQWWKGQGEAAKRVLTPGPLKTINPNEWPQKLSGELALSLPQLKALPWFFRGPQFDATILGTLSDDFGIDTPWEYYNVRDVRTWWDAHGLDRQHRPAKPSQMIPHNAAHDAAYDAWCINQVMHGRIAAKKAV